MARSGRAPSRPGPAREGHSPRRRFAGWAAAAALLIAYGAPLASVLPGKSFLPFLASGAPRWRSSAQGRAACRRPLWRPALAEDYDGAAVEEADAAVATHAQYGVAGGGAWPRRVSVEELEVGQELAGIVQSVRPFGCFVDVGADRDGLVHISRLSDSFVGNIEEVVQPGQEVKVWVSQVTENGKLALSMVQNRVGTGSRESPDLSAFKAIPADQWLVGSVVSIVDYGAFVEVTAPGGGAAAQGLVHLTQLQDGFVNHPSDVVEIGQEVSVRVINVDLFSRRLSLSMKDDSSRPAQREPPDVSAFNMVSPNEWLTGRVRHLANYGAFVELEPPSGGTPVSGLVHLTQMQGGVQADPAEVLELGQEVRVRVVMVDGYAGRLSLSMKEPSG